MNSTRSSNSHAPLADVARRFLLLFVPAAVVLALVLVAVYYVNARTERRLLEVRERNYVRVQAQTIEADFRSVISDLLFLAESQLLDRLFSASADADEPSDEWPETARSTLSEEYATFASRKQMYDQVRLLDEQGNEVIRVNLRGGRAEVVPQSRLQSKIDRYYVHHTLRLEPGQVFVSPFDLNVENGRIENPPKPTIRFATPVFDRAGNRRGLVVLNYMGDKLVEKLQRVSSGAHGQLMLLNAEGYWLHSPLRDDEFAFMFPDRRDRRFPSRFPEAWSEIRRGLDGQLMTSAGMFTFHTVYPIPDQSEDRQLRGVAHTGDREPSTQDYYWKIVSHLEPHTLHARTGPLFYGLVQTYLALGAVLAGGAWSVGRVLADRRQSAAALRESETRFRQMAENINEVFWMTSADGRQTVYVSPAYETVWGRPRDALYDHEMAWVEAVHPEDRERVVAAVFGAPGAAGHNLQYRIVRPDGGVRWIWDRGFPIRDEQGRIIRLAGIAEDTTPLRQAQQQALQAERLAAIGEAMAGLAHESRNALQRSQACLEMLAKRVKDRPEALDLIGRLQAAQNDLHRLYEEVRSYAAPIQLQLESCDLGRVLSKTWEDVRALQNGRAPALRQHRQASDLQCRVDPFAIGQCFRNILDNALSEDHDKLVQRPRAEVEVTWFETELAGAPALGISIRDNGPGLTPDQARSIFEPFYTTKTKGTGLGMAITRRIVMAHGGEISAGSATGGGAEVVIKLPRRKQ